MSAPEVDALVVGAGIAGLAAALELQSAGCEALVVDPGDRPGGVMRTDHVAGYVVESGPSTTFVKAPMRRFLEGRGLAGALVKASPASRLRWLFRDGGFVPLPASPWALAKTPLLSARGKLRLFAEPFRRRGDPGKESAEEFVSRRLGREAATALLGPFLTGVYAGDARQLGAAAVLPALVELEERFGSLFLGSVASLFGGWGPRGLRGSHSTEQGFGPFARRLAELLAEPPALGSRVARVERDGARWHVEVSGPGGDLALSAARVVAAAPAWAVAEIIRSVDAELAAILEGISYAPLVVAAVGVEAGKLPAHIGGFGFLVPRDQDLGLLGCLFMSQLFPGRAPPGHELLQCMLGGTRWPEAVQLPDDVLRERLAADLERTLGLRDAAPPLQLVRWPRAVPQPGRAHAEQMRWAAGRLRECPGLALAGAYVGGVSLADSLASGLSAAAKVLEDVPVG